MTSKIGDYKEWFGRDIKRLAFDVSASGDTSLVAAVAGFEIRLVSLVILGGATVAAKLTDGAAGPDLTGPMDFTAGTVLVLPMDLQGYVETSVNTALVLNLSSALQVTGVLSYVEVE